MEAQTIIFIGPQGSGKGTQARNVGAYLQEHDPERPVIDLETGRHFRALMEGESLTAKRIKALLDDGQMIPNFITKAFVINDLTERLTPEAHLTLDGFPRNIGQVEFIDKLMDFYGRTNLSVIFLDTADAVVTERLMARGRFDDTEELIAERLRLYKEVTEPIVSHYRERTDVQFVEIDGGKPEAEVFDLIKAGIGI